VSATTVADIATTVAVAPPSSSVTRALAPAQAAIEHAADLIGLSFSVPLPTTVIESRLHLRAGMNIGTQNLLMDASGPYGSAFDIVVDPSAKYGLGSSVLVFAAAEQPAALGSAMTLTVTDAFDFTLATDEGYSLPHIGCWIGDAYAPDVVAVIGPPVDSADRGQISPARLAWQYYRDGLTSIDASSVWCELAGEEPVSPNPQVLSDGPVVPQLVGEVGTAEPATEIDRFGNVQLPPGSRVTGMSSLGLPDALTWRRPSYSSKSLIGR
jgi:hypothetical protein